MAWVPTSEREFTIGVRPMRARQVTTSTTEIAHLTIAYLVLSVDIALIAGPLPQIGSRGLLGVANFPAALAVGATAALTGFVAHEMAHKVVAQRYGFWAEFRLSPFGLLISFMTALFGFLFALPGATVVGGIGNEREWGRMSLAGPALNLAEGGAFAAAAVVMVALRFPVAAELLFLLAFFNAWMAAFNLIPIGPIDGRKVFRWNRRVWVVFFVAALAATAALYLVVNPVAL
jgi:Zn-dependent protease